MYSTGEAVRCAEVLAKVSLYPVFVVRGGYQKFSALYPFFRSVKIMYTIMVGSSVTVKAPELTLLMNINTID